MPKEIGIALIIAYSKRKMWTAHGYMPIFIARKAIVKTQLAGTAEQKSLFVMNRSNTNGSL